MQESRNSRSLSKAVKKLEKDVVKEALARNEIKPVDEAVVKLKIILASLFFRLELLVR